MGDELGPRLCVTLQAVARAAEMDLVLVLLHLSRKWSKCRICSCSLYSGTLRRGLLEAGRALQYRGAVHASAAYLITGAPVVCLDVCTGL